MLLDNRTPFPAKLFRSCIDKERLWGSLALRVSYEWVNGRFEPSAEQDWIVSAGPWDTPYGEMPGDELFYRGGVDIFIVGDARPPQGQTASELDVEVQIGAFHYGVRVFGDRVWERSPSGLVPSSPQPIARVPLTLANAYGGKGQWDGLDVPFALNAAGKGFYTDEESAEGMPLPNIEDPANLIGKWDDRPTPVGIGICPLDFGGRMLALIDPATKKMNFSAKFFNSAFPAMIAPRVAPGDTLTVSGISPNPEIKVPIPTAQFEVRLTFDEETVERILPIDQVGLEYERRRIFVSYRYPFRYLLHRKQQRTCTLRQRVP
jgi:hypothetical protein